MTIAIHRLIAKEMIEVKSKQKEKKREKARSGRNQQDEKRVSNAREYMVTSSAENVLEEILVVLTDFEQIQYESFSQEEIELYEKLNEKRNQNIRKALKISL